MTAVACAHRNGGTKMAEFGDLNLMAGMVQVCMALAFVAMSSGVMAQTPVTSAPTVAPEGDTPAINAAPATPSATPEATVTPVLPNMSRLISPEITRQIRDYALQGYLSGLSDRELDLLKARPEDCTRSAFCNGVDPGRISAVAGVILNERAKGAAGASAGWAATTTLISLLVAGFVAWISYKQAKTAREKLVLDLFKDRLAVYAKITEAIRKIQGPGYPVDHEPFSLLHAAKNEATFLFGDEVVDYIKGVLEQAANAGLAHTMMEAQNAGKAPDGTDYPLMMRDASLTLLAVERELPALLAPYMRMAQKLPGPLLNPRKAA